MRRLGLAVLVTAMCAIAVTYVWSVAAGSAPAWAPWILALATPLSMVATMLIGVARPGTTTTGVRRLGFAFGLTLLLLAGGFVLALLLPAADEPLLLGLPRRAAIVLYGVGLLPVLVLPVAYALTFDEFAENPTERARAEAKAAEGDSTAGLTDA